MSSQIRSILTALCCLLLPALADASMSLSRAVLIFQPGDPQRQDIIVRNPDAEPLYIKIEAAEIINPGTPQQERRVAREPEDIDLLVTPNKLVLQPGQEKVVRLVNMKPPADKERIYRVVFTPIVGKIDSDEPMAIKIVIAYDTLVIVEPAKPKSALEAVREGKKITFRNTGNVYALISNGKQCPVEGATDDHCLPVPGTRIYPGTEWSTELPFDRPVTFDIEALQKYQRRQFD